MSDATDRAAALAEIIDRAQVYTLPAIATEGMKQAVNAAISGVVAHTGAGVAIATVTGFGMAHSPKAVNVTLANDDSPYAIATKVKAVLLADADVNGFFDISGVGVNVQLTCKAEAANDISMNLAFAPGSSTGPTAIPASTVLQEGAVADTLMVESILDKYKRAQRWVAGATVVTGGMKILPETPNGRVYSIKKGGTLGISEPFTSIDPYPDLVFDGDAVLEDAGAAYTNIYDIDTATRVCWEEKAAKASRLMSTGGMNMSKIFENCMKMVNLYQTAYVA